MADSKKILEEANYYLDNDVTMKQAANYFGISKKSFQVHMKKLENLFPDKYKLVQEKKQMNLIAGAKKGGQNGKPTPPLVHTPKPFTIEKEMLMQIANSIIKSDLTLREIENIYDIPKSTIHDNLIPERLGEELYNDVVNSLKSRRRQK